MKFDLGGIAALVLDVTENFSEIKECMMRVKLRAVGAGIVSEQFILNPSAVFCPGRLPTASI